jgi:ankyrin repeat protein
MRPSYIGMAFAIAVVATAYCSAQSPPPLLARPRAMYYPHGPGSSPIPVTDLYQAIMENDTREVEVLLRRGANPNEASPPGVFPLIQAMDEQTDPTIAELLIRRGADVNVRTPKNEHGHTNGWSPIFYAIYRKRADLVSVLLKHHAKVTFRDVQGKSPLDWAREVKDAAMIKEIENAGHSHQ